MIFFTGDLHRNIDIQKLFPEKWRFGQTLTKNDYLIICGDFGGVWDDSETDLNVRNWLKDQPWTTLFIEGNHDNHDLLKKYPIEEWNGGKIHKINDSIYHLMRGQVFEVEGYKIFTYGGAYSTDRFRRTEGVDWWKGELPTKEEELEAIENLKKHNNKVDIIITHDIPKIVEQELWFLPKRKMMGTFEDVYGPNYINPRETYRYFYENVDYQYWFMGHMHIDWTVEENGRKYQILFNDITTLKKPWE